MNRREVIGALGGAAWPIRAHAQRRAEPRRIGVLMAGPDTDPERRAYVAALREALATLRWVEGRNVSIHVTWATSDAASTRSSAEEIVALQPDLIVSHNTALTAALLQQTRVIPIIFALVSDPVGSGFVASFARPGGNVTGFTNNDPEMGGKWLELLKEIAPHIGRVTFLFNPTTAPYAEYYIEPFRRSAMSLAVDARAVPVRDPSEIEPTISKQVADGGLIVMTDAFFVGHRRAITSLAARHRVPTVYPFRSFVEDGGLMSYGSSPVDSFRRCAPYVDRILRGEKVSELPVQAPVNFELVINSKTAKALGLTIPSSILTRADDVIE